MAKIEENLRSWLTGYVSLAAIFGERVHVNVVPEESDGPYIFVARATTETEGTIDEQSGAQPFRQVFDVELYAADIADAMDGAELLHAKNTHRGTFGAGKVQGVFVRDHSDDYVPRGAMDEIGLHLAAMQLEIVGHS